MFGEIIAICTTECQRLCAVYAEGRRSTPAILSQNESTTIAFCVASTWHAKEDLWPLGIIRLGAAAHPSNIMRPHISTELTQSVRCTV